MNLIKIGIPLLDSIYLVQEYIEDLDWFIPELIDELKKVRIIEELNKSIMLGTIQGLGTKKGNMNFKKWRNERMLELEELEMKNLTIFERLSRNKSLGTNTLFDRLKYFKEKK